MRLVVFDCINFPSSIVPMAALYIIVERKVFFFSFRFILARLFKTNDVVS